MLLLAAVISISGCEGTVDSEGHGKSASSPGSPRDQPSVVTPMLASGWKREEISFNYAAMKEDVKIQVDGDPRIQSPLRSERILACRNAVGDQGERDHQFATRCY